MCTQRVDLEAQSPVQVVEPEQSLVAVCTVRTRLDVAVVPWRRAAWVPNQDTHRAQYEDHVPCSWIERERVVAMDT